MGMSLLAQNSKRWKINSNGSIDWMIEKPAEHIDHIEMSGLQVSAIIHYGVSEKGELVLQKKIVFPMLRTIPNNTHASLTVDFNETRQPEILVDGNLLAETPVSFTLRGKIIVKSSTATSLSTTRIIFPSVDKPAIIEIIKLRNNGSSPVAVEIKNSCKPRETDPEKGVYGKYIVRMDLSAEGRHIIGVGEELSFASVFSGRKESDQPYSWSAGYELNKRERFIDGIFSNLVLDTPDDTLNREFAFAKLRTTESIYDTKGGLMHGPGGGAYYAAIWANDQAEYADPFFPFLGNLNGNESAINSYRLFARYMNPEYKPLPSSIIAEGTDSWNGAGDRGDMAMIAYGASRFALASGKPEIARELWPLIKWCFEYLDTKLTGEGVIASDNDELEGRFPAGKANLSTNSLAYGGYLSASHLAGELGYNDLKAAYSLKAKVLRENIEKYFGASVQGYNTYRYFTENDKLRSWICLPLVMGITERKDETIKALFSKYLWTSNGILTESGSTTFWDRATLYAFRGLFASGATDEGMKYFSYYSAMRLLGEHVPYPVEAWPEGGQRHLAAESALYCRAVTEGLFGITPTGFNRFTLAPWLPKGWNYMNLKNVKAFDNTFDIEVRRKGSKESIVVKREGKESLQMLWDRKAPVEIIL